jgi:GNAT superfamily N-acetyltransferase
MKLAAKPLTAERFGDLEAIFDAKGCSIARGCWCMCYRVGGKETPPPGLALREHRKAQMRALAAADPPAGLIGYRGREPVGWVSLGPREDFAKLKRSPVMKPIDDAPVWSIVCFVVPKAHRHQGVAAALLAAAIAWAKRRGVKLLEAYPIDKRGRADDEWLWHGTKSMFDQAGFGEVARRRPERPIVRLALAS